MKNWSDVLKSTLSLEALVKTLPTKGNLAYEYNPFRNYRLTKDMYEYDGNLWTKEELGTKYKIKVESTQSSGEWTDVWTKDGVEMAASDIPAIHLKGELVDFVTDELNFSLDHPVHILPQYSYDGSVNLILTDGVNQPRLINSRFSATGKNTYEIVDRKGNNDTNIYDQGEQFDIDTSLYKRVKLIPTLELKSVRPGGTLHCGNYHFYFKLADADGNETDFVAESGLVSLFVGYKYPNSIYSGNKNENSVKQVQFKLSNIDPSYNYVYVYYTRATAEDGNNKIIEYKKIDKKYLVNNVKVANILIDGSEDTDTIAATDINLDYNVVDAANCAVTAKSMLFLGNVHKPSIPYETLSDLSLRFLPYLKDTPYDLTMDQNYNISSTSKGYYDPMYIYKRVGYWDQEMYRLGIVYILSNGELSSVFNIRGRLDISAFSAVDTKADSKSNFADNTVNDGSYAEYYFYKKIEGKVTDEAVTVRSGEYDNLIIPPEDGQGYIADPNKSNYYENSKGVVSINCPNDTNVVHGFEIRVSDTVISRLKALGIKGFFFVRQGRIPLTLCQGITVGVDNVGRVPTIPIKDGILSGMESSLDGSTYVETDNINAENFISEGFLSRYKFELKRKSSSIWAKIGTIVAIAAAAAAMVAASIVTCGAAAIATAAGALSVSTTTMSAIVIGGAVAGTAIAAASTAVAVATTEEIVYAVNRATHSKELKGRNTEIASGYYRSELDESRRLGADFKDRIIIKDFSKNSTSAILCPDYDVAPQTYNQYFTGTEMTLKVAKSQAALNKFYRTVSESIRFGYRFTNSNRHCFMQMNAYASTNSTDVYTSRIQAVPDNTSCVAIGTKLFRSKAGSADEAWRYVCMGTDYLSVLSSSQDEYDEDDDEDEPPFKQTNTDIVRGSFGPYLGMDSYNGYVGETVSIMVPGYSESMLDDYVKIRMQDSSSYSAISDRIDIANLQNYYQAQSNLTNDSTNNKNCSFTVYRGDCYICQFTHRLIRNFNDSSAPYNDVIVDSTTWKDHYKVSKSSEFSSINAGDVNAVKLGMWVTFTVRSSRNLNIRSLDASSTEECTKMNHPKGFYPYHGMIVEGSYKSAEALVYNDGFTQNLSQRINFTQPDAPYIKNWFGTRIMYSDVNITDGISNGYRVFQGQNYRDYTREYGEIVKLINYNDDLFVVFEHGLALIPINERAVASQSSGGNVYINTSEVLPETPNVLSGTYGSIWPDSVILVPPITGSNGTSGPSIFGVDTVAKKIWRYNGQLSIISDFKVQEFLNQNLTLTERENTPIMGVRNVKTAYNAFKHDVMFTFYDDLNTTSEKVWNLCYNILMDQFTTFYSWVPSYMENINNIPFSFDRNVSKWIAKLGQSHAENSFAEGIVLSQNIYNNNGKVDGYPNISFKYLTKTGNYANYKWVSEGSYAKVVDTYNLVGILNLVNQVIPEGNNIQCFEKFDLLRDIYGYYKLFSIKLVTHIKLPSDAKYSDLEIPIYGLYFDPEKSKLYKEYEGAYIQTSDSGDLEDSNTGTDNDKSFDGNIQIEETKSTITFEDAKNSYFTELYYRNYTNSKYNDYDDHKVTIKERDTQHCVIPAEYTTKYYGEGNEQAITLTEKNYFSVMHTLNLPIFHDRTGARVPLKTPLHKNKLVQLLNIKASIWARFTDSKTTLNEATLAEYLNYLKAKGSGTENNVETQSGWISAGSYESSVAITSKWNYEQLDSSFWRHGQAGVFDHTEDILPTKWYGEQHPFEFEVVVNDNPGIQKIFHNIEIVSNKAKPESFHFEIVGESYDFAKDKVNMYFRQEARKALFQYNGCDIEYNSNFLKTNPKQQPKSAELVHTYYERQDTIEDVYDSYVGEAINDTNYSEMNSYKYSYDFWAAMAPDKDYRHLSGAEIVYYPTRQEYRVWQHQPAIDIDDLSQDTATSIIKANCQYLEDRWRVSINPLLITYKNEYVRNVSGSLIQPENSTWPNAMNSDYSKSENKLPPITLYNTSLPNALTEAEEVNFPDAVHREGTENALFGLYSWEGNLPVDTTNWLNDISIYKTSFGEAQNRKEADLRDKFIKIRIRYSGEELAVIQFLNTIYSISYA